MRTTRTIAAAAFAFGTLTLMGIGVVHAQEMPKTVAQALVMEQADRLPLTDF